MSQQPVPYQTDPKYSIKTAYFSMEFAIDQALKTYSGGLGFLAGSHVRSAYELKQNFVGIGLLWKYGYYDQVRDSKQYMKKELIRKQYSFLEDPGIVFTVNIHGTDVKIKAYHLRPETFGTAPMYFLTTDIEENDYLSRTITDRLYDPDEAARIAQSIVLGAGGARLLEILQWEPDVYHLNEGHGIPLAFFLYKKFKHVEEVKKHLVFTTHTPEKAGNEEHSLELLNKMHFFGDVPLDEVKKISGADQTLNYTLTALRLSKIANGVSAIHGAVSKDLCKDYQNICPIISITNAQNRYYWEDATLATARQQQDDHLLLHRKKELKKALFDVVADQCGKIFDPEVLTIVWARRFAGYKRADLLLKDFEHFHSLVTRNEQPIQIIWAGKPYPEDTEGIRIFNQIAHMTFSLPRCSILTGYELSLSAILKKGADVWLNTPRPPQEASGTSGMSAAMNGTINVSIADGWFPEFSKNRVNSFILPAGDIHRSEDQRNGEDHANLIKVLEEEIIPTYYTNKERWKQLMKNAMNDVFPAFDSARMANEYYEKLYCYE